MKYLHCLSLTCLLLFSPSLLWATNGYLMHGYGTKNKALGGSGSANPQDALVVAANPAGMVFLGNRFDITGELFIPTHGYKFQGQDTVTSNNDMFGLFKGYYIIPSMGMNYMIDSKNSVGFSIYGAGLGTNYDPDDTPTIGQDTNITLQVTGPKGTVNFQTPANGTFFDGWTGVDLLLLLNNFSYAHKFTDKTSVGIGLIFAAQSFKAEGLELFKVVSDDPDNLTNKGRDWAFGFGFNIGFQTEIVEDVRMYASYQPEIKLEHDKYKGLFAGGNGDLSLARQANLGFAVDVSPTSVFSFDIQYIWWSEVTSVGNDFDDFNVTQITPFPIINFTGSADGPGFGWRDSLVFKMGYQWKFDNMLPDWTFRVGGAYQEQIVPPTETLFGLLAPATITTHVTAGFTWDMDEYNEISFSFLYAPTADVSGSDFASGVDKIFLGELAFELGWGLKFGK